MLCYREYPALQEDMMTSTNKTIRTATWVVLLVLLNIYGWASAEGRSDSAAELAALEASNSADGGAWLQLASNARDAGDLITAAKAIEHAELLEFSPVRVGLEKMRIAIREEKPAIAEAEMKKLSDLGFNAVQLFTNDIIINELDGRPNYDSIVATMTRAAFPCENQEGFKDFDFWRGDWVVHTANGQLAGHNSIKSSERGCLLLENWRSASGGTGMSINYLDKSTDEWVQIWNAAGGSQINIRGGLTDDGMLLVGQIHYVSNGTTAPFRGLWTLLEDGRVRQFFEQSNDQGKSWQPWFEGFYTKDDKVDASL